MRLARRPTISAVIVFLFASAPGRARANPLEAFGLGGRGPAMANAQTAAANDFAAVFYNPAALFQIPQIDGVDTFALTSTLAVDRLYIRDLEGRDIGNPVENVYAIGVGAADGLGTDWIRLGITAFLPVFRLQLQRTHYIDEREYRHTNRLSYELYGERFQRQVVLPAIAIRPVRFLSLAAAGSVFTFSRTGTRVYLPDPTDQSKAEINLYSDQENTLTPQIGALLEPRASFRLGVSYRGSERFPIQGPNDITLNPDHELVKQGLIPPEYLNVVQPVDFIIQFQPVVVAGGAAYDYSPNLTLAADVWWSGWSRYVDNHNESPLPKLNDVLSTRMGLDYQLGPRWRVRGGYAYEPSPVPAQDLRTNLVDNDKHVLSTGLEFRYPMEGYQAVFEGFLQDHLFVTRTQRKLPADRFSPYDHRPATPEVDNPGFPGYRSGGSLFAMGATFSLRR